MNEEEVIELLKKFANETKKAVEQRSVFDEPNFKKLLIKLSKQHYSIFDDILYLYQYQKEKNNELLRITHTYNATKEYCFPEEYKVIVADERYFQNGILKENFIHKDKIKGLQGELCMKLGSYVRNESTPEQERIAGAINILNKILKEEE